MISGNEHAFVGAFFSISNFCCVRVLVGATTSSHIRLLHIQLEQCCFNVWNGAVTMGNKYECHNLYRKEWTLKLKLSGKKPIS